jgi:hypothetical protein
MTAEEINQGYIVGLNINDYDFFKMKSLLKNYMRLVIESEGVSFVGNANEEQWCGITPFTKEEIELLKKLEKEISEE